MHRSVKRVCTSIVSISKFITILSVCHRAMDLWKATCNCQHWIQFFLFIISSKYSISVDVLLYCFSTFLPLFKKKMLSLPKRLRLTEPLLLWLSVCPSVHPPLSVNMTYHYLIIYQSLFINLYINISLFLSLSPTVQFPFIRYFIDKKYFWATFSQSLHKIVIDA